MIQECLSGRLEEWLPHYSDTLTPSAAAAASLMGACIAFLLSWFYFLKFQIHFSSFLYNTAAEREHSHAAIISWRPWVDGL